MQVMLVEDDRAVMMVTKAYIKSFGHDVIAVEDAETALEKFDIATVDLILMDYILPDMDGFEATRVLRKRYPNDWFPIIFLTSSDDDQNLVIGLEAGGDDYLNKPVTPIVLESKLKAMQRIVEMQRDLVAANKKMEQLSYLDGLTHIYNRRGFDRAASAEWKRMQRDGNILSLLMIDVDYFKKFNDHYGHQEGDDCLKLVASTLEGELFRPADIVARYGGEEFVVLLPGTDSEGAMKVAKRLVKSIENLNVEHVESEASDYVTISAGLACCTKEQKMTISRLVKNADEALYKAKSSGRNRCM